MRGCKCAVCMCNCRCDANANFAVCAVCMCACCVNARCVLCACANAGAMQMRIARCAWECALCGLGARCFLFFFFSLFSFFFASAEAGPGRSCRCLLLRCCSSSFLSLLLFSVAAPSDWGVLIFARDAGHARHVRARWPTARRFFFLSSTLPSTLFFVPPQIQRACWI